MGFIISSVMCHGTQQTLGRGHSLQPRNPRMANMGYFCRKKRKGEEKKKKGGD